MFVDVVQFHGNARVLEDLLRQYLEQISTREYVDAPEWGIIFACYSQTQMLNGECTIIYSRLKNVSEGIRAHKLDNP